MAEIQIWESENSPPSQGAYMWFTGPRCFIVLHGKKIAERQNKKWVDLTPQYKVRLGTNGDLLIGALRLTMH